MFASSILPSFPPSLPLTHLEESQLGLREDGPLFFPLPRRPLAWLLLALLEPPTVAEQATAAATAGSAGAADAAAAGGCDRRVQQLALVVRIAARTDDPLVNLLWERRWGQTKKRKRVKQKRRYEVVEREGNGP